jgi:hypothetical protein
MVEERENQRNSIRTVVLEVRKGRKASVICSETL